MGVFSQALRKQMENEGISMSTLPAKYPLSYEELNAWVEGTKLPSNGKLETLAPAVHMPVYKLRDLVSQDRLSLATLKAAKDNEAFKAANKVNYNVVSPSVAEKQPMPDEPVKPEPKPMDKAVGAKPSPLASNEPITTEVGKPAKRPYHRREHPVKEDTHDEQTTDSKEYQRLKECLKVLQDDADTALNCLIGAIEMRNFDAIKTYANIAWARNVAVKAIKKALDIDKAS